MEEKDKVKKDSEFWSDFSREYDRILYEDVAEYPSLIVRHNYILDLFDKDGGNVLDIGCGPGKMLVDLRKRGCTVTGVDIAEGMLEVARDNLTKAFPEEQPNLAIGDIEKLDFPDATFDTVICAGVVEYLNDDYKALSEINRVLKPGGKMIITVRNKMCPARVIDYVLDFVKGIGPGLTMLNLLNKMIKGKNAPDIKFTSYRKHSPGVFDKNVANVGFIKEDFRYFHFYPFFVPFDKLFPKFFVKQGLKLEKLTNTGLGWLGSGYIVKARKK